MSKKHESTVKVRITNRYLENITHCPLNEDYVAWANAIRSGIANSYPDKRCNSHRFIAKEVLNNCALPSAFMGRLIDKSTSTKTIVNDHGGTFTIIEREYSFAAPPLPELVDYMNLVSQLTFFGVNTDERFKEIIRMAKTHNAVYMSKSDLDKQTPFIQVLMLFNQIDKVYHNGIANNKQACIKAMAGEIDDIVYKYLGHKCLISKYMKGE